MNRNHSPLLALGATFVLSLCLGAATAQAGGAPACTASAAGAAAEGGDRSRAGLELPTAEELSELLRRLKEEHDVEALLFGLWVGDEEVLTEALGDSMTGVPATLDMRFRTGSITISFLTTLLLQAVDRGDLTLDDRLSTWFPDLPDAGSVTLRMLANSTSGYADYVQNEAFLEALMRDPFRRWQAEELIRLGMEGGLLFEPGSDFHYAHTNFVLLEEVLARATGSSVDELVRRDILEPLSLDDTSYPLTADGASFTAQIRPPVLHAFVSGRGVYEDSTHWNPSWVSYYGGLISNLRDLGRWSRALGSGELLTEASYEEMIASTSVGFAGMSPEFYYGLGVVVADCWIVQNPSFSGYQAILGHLPSRGVSLVVVTTQGRASDPEAHYAQLVFRELVERLETAP